MSRREALKAVATVASRAAREGEITSALAVLGVYAQEPAFITAARKAQPVSARGIRVVR